MQSSDNQSAIPAELTKVLGHLSTPTYPLYGTA